MELMGTSILQEGGGNGGGRMITEENTDPGQKALIDSHRKIIHR
jgi:hypothetical protein